MTPQETQTEANSGLNAEQELSEVRQLLREMFADGDLSRAEYESLETNPEPFATLLRYESEHQ